VICGEVFTILVNLFSYKVDFLCSTYVLWSTKLGTRHNRSQLQCFLLIIKEEIPNQCSISER